MAWKWPLRSEAAFMPTLRPMATTGQKDAVRSPRTPRPRLRGCAPIGANRVIVGRTPRRVGSPPPRQASLFEGRPLVHGSPPDVAFGARDRQKGQDSVKPRGRVIRIP